MSNSMKGAVSFEADGASHYLRLTTNAQVRYQDAADETFLHALGEVEKDPSDMRRIRRLFWAAMSHVDGLTEDGAGEIMDELGLMEAANLLSQAANAAFPEQREEAGNAPRAKKSPTPKTP